MNSILLFLIVLIESSIKLIAGVCKFMCFFKIRILNNCCLNLISDFTDILCHIGDKTPWICHAVGGWVGWKIWHS